MITVGIDVGSISAKAALVRGRPAGRVHRLSSPATTPAMQVKMFSMPFWANWGFDRDAVDQNRGHRIRPQQRGSGR
jgi:hypothetical protein